MAEKLGRNAYLTKNTGDFASEIIVGGKKFIKADDLRYGTNPHQPAAFYIPEGSKGAIANMKTLKSGKNGLSQTNLEDISGALNIVKYFDIPAEEWIAAIEKSVPAKFLELNKKAFRLGLES